MVILLGFSIRYVGEKFYSQFTGTGLYLLPLYTKVNKTDIVNSLPADLTVITADGTEKANYNGAMVYAADLEETLTELQSQQRSFFDLLTGFMLLGLVVGIVSLGVISARAVVERRHAIGVMRAIGFSKRSVLLTFIGESSFIGIMGILIGIILGIVTGVNVMADIRDSADPDIKTIIPWVKFALIGIGAYVMSLITTLIPALQASEVAPAEALRYE